MTRSYTAKLLGIDMANIRVNPAEIGGGFGGKTLVYLEPVAVALSKKSGRSVKMQMTREEVFRASGPTSGATMEVKLGAKKDGTIVAAKQVLKYQAGAFPGSPIGPGCMCGFAMYDLPNVDVVGYDVVSNRPKVAAYRAPGAPITSFAVESAMDDLALKLGMDPLTLREKNAAKNGTKTHYGPTHQNIGFTAVLDAVKSHPALEVAAEAGPGPRPGHRLLVQHRRRVHARPCMSNEDGSVTAATGSPDIGGSRASIGMMVAEVLGVPAERVRTIVADTPRSASPSVTGGSRVTFATGMAATQAAEKVVDELKRRAAATWDIPVDAVEWKDGMAYPAGSNAGAFEPLDLAALALKAARTGGPINAEVSVNAQGAGRRLRRAYLRRVGRQGDRPRHDRALHGDPGRRQGDPSQLRRRPDPGRCGAGHRLGAERGIHLQRQGPDGERGLPRLPRAGRLRRADDRGGAGGGAEPAPSVRRARRGRGADRSADGGDRQRDPRRDRPADARPADVAAEGAAAFDAAGK